MLYVNGKYRGDSDIGKPMYDFNCTDTKDMDFKLLADCTMHLKENPNPASILLLFDRHIQMLPMVWFAESLSSACLLYGKHISTTQFLFSINPRHVERSSSEILRAFMAWSNVRPMLAIKL